MARGKILDIQSKGISTVYNYICIGDDNNLFSFPVEHRYHRELLIEIGDLIGMNIEYHDSKDPPYLRFV
jgi:hypothetical protein